MACQINFKAPNGAESILYRDLLNQFPTVETAVKYYLKYKDIPVSSMDLNGEPTLKAVLNKIKQDAELNLLNKKNNLLNEDGSKKQFVNETIAGEVARKANNNLRGTGKIAKVSYSNDTNKYTINIVSNDELNSPSLGDLNVIHFERISKAKIEELNNAKDRIRSLNIKLGADRSWAKGLTEQQTNEKLRLFFYQKDSLTKRIEVIEQSFKVDSSPRVLEHFEYMFQEDLKYIDILLDSYDSEDLFLAKSIINMYTRIGDFENKLENHPIFSKEQIESGEVSKEIKDSFKQMSLKMNSFVPKFNKLLEKSVLDVIQQHSALFKKLNLDASTITYDRVIEAIDDINVWDKAFHRADTNVFTKSGKKNLLSALIVRLMQESTERATTRTQSKILKLKELLPKLDERLKQLGFKKGNLYEIFKQKFTGEDTWTGRLITRFSEKYFSDSFEYNKQINLEISKIYDILRNEGLSQEQIKKYNNDITKLIESRNKWYKNTHEYFDINRLSALHTEFADIIENPVVDLEYEDFLKNQLGEWQFNKLIEEQRNKLKVYRVERELTLAELNSDGTDLEFKIWETLNNPYSLRKYVNGEELTITMEDGTVRPFSEVFQEHLLNDFVEKNQDILSDYQIAIEKANIFNRNIKFGLPIKNNAIVVVPLRKNKETGLDTGYYDNTFDTIQEDPVLSEFYDFMINTTQNLYDHMPDYAKKDFQSNSLSLVKKDFMAFFMEGMSNGNLRATDLIKMAGKDFHNMLVKGLTSDSYETDEAFSEFIENPDSKVNYGYLQKVKNIVNPVYQRLIEEATNRGEELTPEHKKQLRINATNEVLSNYSFDLGNVLAYYISMTELKNARNEVLPMINTLHYVFNEKLLDKNGKQRTEDIERMQHQVKVFTGNRTQKIELESDRKILTSEESDEVKKLQGVIRDMLNSESLSNGIPISSLYPGSQELSKAIDDAAEDEDQRLLKILRLIDRLGNNVTGSAIGDGLLKYLRFLSIGWNIGSIIPNMAAGYYANMALAAEEKELADGTKLISLKNMVRAYKIAFDSILNNLSFGKIKTDNARKVYSIMTANSFLSDSSNDFQKAKVTSTISGKWEMLHPFTPNSRQEYVNQSVIVISRYMGIPVTRADGTVSNLWDALDAEGNLKPEFDTEENRTKFSNDSDYMIDSRIQIRELINRTHGDYSELGRMMANKTFFMRCVVLMKKWMFSAIMVRFGTEQGDLNLGVGTKGRYRSYDRNSLTFAATVLGSVTFGIPGLIFTGGLAFGVGSFYGNNTGNVPFTKNLQYLGQRLLYSRLMWFNSEKYADKMSNQYNEYFTPLDAANMRANMQELANLLSLFAIYLVSKMVLFDEDDEKDSLRRQTHNIVINQILKINKDLYYFSSLSTPSEFIKNAFPIGRLVDNSKSVVESATKLVLDKELKSNENTMGDNLMKFVPSVFKPVFGELPFSKADLNKPTQEAKFYQTLIEGNYGEDSKKKTTKASKKKTEEEED
jgi:hypothetical protein